VAVVILRADLEQRLGAAEVARYAKAAGAAGDAAVDEAIAMAWDSARSAGLNVFTPESWDAMDASTLPPEAKMHIVSHAADILSAGNKRPEEIEKKAEEARLWRSFLAGDTVRSFDLVLTRIGEGEYDAGVVYTAKNRVFGRTRTSTLDLDHYDPTIGVR
jgi:hypothetical protein